MGDQLSKYEIKNDFKPEIISLVQKFVDSLTSNYSMERTGEHS